MTDLERLKRAEEAEPMAVVVMDKMPEECGECILKRGNMSGIWYNCTAAHDERVWELDKPDWCPLRPAIGIIEPNGHVVYLREDGEE